VRAKRRESGGKTRTGRGLNYRGTLIGGGGKGKGSKEGKGHLRMLYLVKRIKKKRV